MRALRTRLFVLAVLTALSRLLPLVLGPVTLEKDAVGYWQLAGALLEGRGLVLDGVASALRLPGYPLFVALVRAVWDAPAAVVVAHALLDGVNVVLVGRLAFMLSRREGQGRPRVALAAGAAWALYPYTFAYAARVITETASVTLLLLVALAATQPRLRYFVRGGLVGLGVAALAYVKPTFLFFVPCWFAWRLVRRPRAYRSTLATGAVAFLVFGLAFAPWPVRNRLVLDRWVLGATNFGQSFFNGVYGLGTLGNPWDDTAVEFGPGGAPPAEREKREALLEGIRELPEVERNAALARVSFELVREDPLHFARNAALTVPRVWLRFPWEMPPTARGLALTAIQLAWLGAAVAGYLRRRRRGLGEDEARILMFVEAVAIYVSGVHTVTTAVVRYSFPAMALLCVLIGQLADDRPPSEREMTER